MVRQGIKAIFALLLFTTVATATDEPFPNALRVFGPGGPHRVLDECAQLYSERSGVDVVVSKALPHNLNHLVSEHGDIYYGGAPYMLERFDDRNPGVLDLNSVEHLYPRQIGIIVRDGNPLDIQGLECLSRNDVELLDVKLEEMHDFHGAFEDGIHRVESFVYTGLQGLNSWRSNPKIDAWVTYKSWFLHLGDEAHFVEIPGEDALRPTPVALTTHTKRRQEAKNFLEFLKTDVAYEIFQKHGWD